MRVIQAVSALAAVGLFTGGILIGSSIARDVDDALGTTYGGIWNSSATIIWKEHERLFPFSRKRSALIAVFLASVGLFMTVFLDL